MARDLLLDREYDGIQMYDNPCPGWWHVIFWLMVVFGVNYFLFFHCGSNGWTLAESWNSAKAADVKKRFSGMGDLQNDVPTLLKYKADPEWMVYANSLFLSNCQSCHGSDGSGLVGPNLTDDNYKNVKKITDIAEVIKNGAAGGSMPAWGNRLHPNEVILMAAYVAGLRGKNLKGRGPEGDKIPDWPAAPAEDVEGKQKEAVSEK